MADNYTQEYRMLQNMQRMIAEAEKAKKQQAKEYSKFQADSTKQAATGRLLTGQATTADSALVLTPTQMLALRKRDAEAKAKSKEKEKAESGRSITEAGLEFGKKALEAKKSLEGLNAPDENATVQERVDKAGESDPLKDLLKSRVSAYQDSAQIAKNLEKMGIQNFDSGVQVLEDARRAVSIEWPRAYAEAYKILLDENDITNPSANPYIALRIQQMAKEAANKKIENEYGRTVPELQNMINQIEGK